MMPVQTSTRHTLYRKGGGTMGESKSVLRLVEVKYGTKNREQAFYEALAPYFEGIKRQEEAATEQRGSEEA